MDYSNIGLFSALKTKMGYLSQRQEVIAQNIANIDTPGYTPRDLKKPEFENLMMTETNRLAMRMTASGHMNTATASNADGSFQETKQRKTYELNPNKNRVVGEEQMMMGAQNKMEYEKSINQYKKWVGWFKTALGTQS